MLRHPALSFRPTSVAMAYLELVGLLIIFAVIAWLAWKSM